MKCRNFQSDYRKVGFKKFTLWTSTVILHFFLFAIFFFRFPNRNDREKFGEKDESKSETRKEACGHGPFHP